MQVPLPAMAAALVIAAVVLLIWTHVSLNREERSFLVGRQSQLLEDKIHILLDKHRALEAKYDAAFSPLAAPSRQQQQQQLATGTLSQADKLVPQMSNVNSAEFQLAREISARYNIRYWLETKPFWPPVALPAKAKFLSFEPWPGGFNNIRMSLEMAAAMALALNRTLVMPPTYKMYLRGTSSFQDYFDYQDMKRGMSVVTYQEFRALVSLGKADGLGEQGPDSTQMADYYAGLKKMAPGRVAIVTEKTHNMIGSQLVFCFPKCGQGEWFKRTQHKLRAIDTSLQPEVYHDPEILHFGPMLLGHFYTMVWFQDPMRGQHVKRVVRDHIHFHEEMFAYAERVIKQLGGDFAYSCLHIRRNDFQFKEVWTPADKIVSNVAGLLREGETVYIATDELSLPKSEVGKQWSDPMAMSRVKSHEWFEPMFAAWGGPDKVKFWSDFHDELNLGDIKKIWIASVESIVCSRARVFVGTQKSTFSGYIWRMRGYMHDVGQKEYLDAQTAYPEGYFPALPGPSWGSFPSGAFGGGHPYWGREYRESFAGVYDPFY